MDYPKPDFIGYSVRELIGLRVFGLVLDSEDLSGHARLRFDLLLSAAIERLIETGHKEMG